MPLPDQSQSLGEATIDQDDQKVVYEIKVSKPVMTYLWVIGAGILSLQLVSIFASQELKISAQGQYLSLNHSFDRRAELGLAHRTTNSNTLESDVNVTIQNEKNSRSQNVPLEIEID